MRQIDRVLSRLVQLMQIKNGGLGVGPLAAQLLGDFCDFSAKNSHFIAIQINFCNFLELGQRTKLLKLESQLKNDVVQPFQAPSHSQVKSKACLNACFWVKLSSVTLLREGGLKPLSPPDCATVVDT